MKWSIHNCVETMPATAGLRTAGHIDNAESDVTEAHGSICECAQSIRTAMAQQRQHPAQRTPVDPCVAARRVVAGNSAHARVPRL